MEKQVRCILCGTISWVPFRYEFEPRCESCYNKCVFCLERTGQLTEIKLGPYVGMSRVYRMCDDPECIKTARANIPERVKRYYQALPSQIRSTPVRVRGATDCRCGQLGSKLECGRYRCNDHDDCACYICCH